MEPLEPPDSHHLSAAIGWLELGDWREARDEWDKIAPELRTHPHALAARYEIWASAGNWDEAAEIAQAIFDGQQTEPHSWVVLAYATRRKNGGGIPQAKEILEKAAGLFPKEPIIRFNLACYNCQLGDLDAAWGWLEKAGEAGDPKAIKQMALADPDLEPLRQRIRES